MSQPTDRNVAPDPAQFSSDHLPGPPHVWGVGVRTDPAAANAACPAHPTDIHSPPSSVTPVAAIATSSPRVTQGVPPVLAQPSSTSSPRYMQPTESSLHHMQTRSKHGIVVPKKHFNISASSNQVSSIPAANTKDTKPPATTLPISPLPASYRFALKDPHWHRAMVDEYNTLINNNTWCLVP